MNALCTVIHTGHVQQLPSHQVGLMERSLHSSERTVCTSLLTRVGCCSLFAFPVTSVTKFTFNLVSHLNHQLCCCSVSGQGNVELTFVVTP